MATGKINLDEFKYIVKTVINEVEIITGERPKDISKEMEAITKGFFRKLFTEEFNRKQAIKYFKIVWAKDPGVKKKILLNIILTKKFGKYLKKGFKWESLENKELVWVWSEWEKCVAL